MIRYITYFIIFVTLIFIAGCNTYISYPQIVSPQAVDIPLIKEMGDLRVDVGGSFTGNKTLRSSEAIDTEEWSVLPSVHGTISYGMSNMSALQMHANIGLFSMYYFQTALGIYKVLEKKTVFELYGGYGYGNGYYNTRMFKVRDDYHLAFAQFNIGQTGLGAKHIDYGLGLRGGYLFCNFEEPVNLKDVHKKNGWMVEPTVFFRFGGRKVKFCTKVTYLWTQTLSKDFYYPLSVSMGVNLSL